jgi:nucleoside-diphosphate-sugar epimerase
MSGISGLMKILVTGASRFLAQELGCALLEGGHSVITRSRNDPPPTKHEIKIWRLLELGESDLGWSDLSVGVALIEVVHHLPWSGVPSAGPSQ